MGQQRMIWACQVAKQRTQATGAELSAGPPSAGGRSPANSSPTTSITRQVRQKLARPRWWMAAARCLLSRVCCTGRRQQQQLGRQRRIDTLE